MKDKIKVGIIGAGMIARDGHIPAYRFFSNDVSVDAICTSKISSAKSAAEELNVPFYFASAEEMLSSMDLDLVSICTPNMSHYEYVKLALEHGVNVLCEKPVTLKLKEAEELFKLTEEKGLMLEACQTLRFNSEFSATREEVLAGKLGRVSFANCTCVRRRGAPARGAFLSSKLNGGGALADIGVHFLDATLWMMGSPKAISVTGMKCDDIIHNERNIEYSRSESGAYGNAKLSEAVDRDSCDVEDFASGTIRLEGGGFLNFCIGWNANMPATRSYMILGDKAGITLPGMNIYGTDGNEIVDLNPEVPPLGKYTEVPFPGHFYLIENVIDHLKNGTSLIIQPSETINIAAVLEMFYRSCEEGREVFRDEL